MNRTILVIVAILALTLGGCGSRLTGENLAKVETGMSIQQVEALLGKPTSVETQGALGVEGTVYLYKSGKKEVSIIFANGKVIMKSGSL
ncbi:MAG: outer membrane protein assembly factor BamE [Deltaproteobacteria bacterium]|nr:outer membrane protein assembly factor BamE [Deltaproteobacteria bacterium]